MSKGIVLAVDDSTESLRLLVQILTREGYTVTPADGGQMALASVAAQRPDIILLDIRMPDPDGFAVCRRLKVHPDTRNIPIIFLSGETNIDEQVEGLRLGAVDFIRKPVRPDELLARVRTHVDLGRMHSSLEETLLTTDIRFRTAWESLETPMMNAVEARDWPLVGRLFEPNAFIKLHQFRACRNLILNLPPEAIVTHMGLAFWRAYTLMAYGRLVEAREAALAVDRNENESISIMDRSRIKSLLARITDLQGDGATAVDLATQGLALVEGAESARIALAHHWLATSLCGAGRPGEAAEHFLIAVAHQEEQQGVRRWLIPLVMCWYARARFMQGRLNDAMTICRNAFAYERQYEGPSIGLNYALEAEILLARSLLDTARQSVEKAVEQDFPVTMPMSWLTAAAVYYACDDHRRGDRAVNDLIHWADNNDAVHIRDKAESLRCLSWLRNGEIKRARKWVAERGLSEQTILTFATEPILLALARVYVHTAQETSDTHDAERAITVAHRLQQAADADSRMRDYLAALVLEALAVHQLGDVDRALALLERCLAMAVPESAFRVFVDEGRPMLDLLSVALERGRLPDTVNGLIAMFAIDTPTTGSPSQPEVVMPGGNAAAGCDSPIGDGTTLVNPLTDREYELLGHIAAGHSNAELAEALFISNNTVKTHIKHLYQKLNAGSRAEAIGHARVLGLIGKH